MRASTKGRGQVLQGGKEVGGDVLQGFPGSNGSLRGALGEFNYRVGNRSKAVPIEDLPYFLMGEGRKGDHLTAGEDGRHGLLARNQHDRGSTWFFQGFEQGVGAGFCHGLGFGHNYHDRGAIRGGWARNSPIERICSILI